VFWEASPSAAGGLLETIRLGMPTMTETMVLLGVAIRLAPVGPNGLADVEKVVGWLNWRKMRRIGRVPITTSSGCRPTSGGLAS
jgi:hypothetical protein